MALELPKNLSMSSMVPRMKPVQNSLFEVVLLVVVIGLFAWFVIQPKRAELAVQQDKLSQFQQEESAISENLNKLKILVRQMKSQPDKVAALDEALPLRGNLIHLEMLIDSLAKSSGVSVGEIGVSPRSGVAVAGNMEIIQSPFTISRSLQKTIASVQVMGTFEQLDAFIKKLEKSSRIMNISTMEIRSGEEGSINLSINLEAYSYE